MLCARLEGRVRRLLVHDPHCGHPCWTALDVALAEASLVFIAVAHREYRHIEFRNGQIVIDPRIRRSARDAS